MTVQVGNTKDYYDLVTQWWVGHKFPIVPVDMLPEHLFVTYNSSGELTHFMFIYHTNSNLCWLAFPVSNPNLSKEDRKGCLEGMMKASVEYCKQMGFRYIFTTSPVESIQSKLTSVGFELGDEGVNHYIKML